MPIDSRPRLLGPARAGRERVRVVLQLPAASSEPAGPDARPTAPSLFPAAPDVTYVLGQYNRALRGSSPFKGFFAARKSRLARPRGPVLFALSSGRASNRKPASPRELDP